MSRSSRLSARLLVLVLVAIVFAGALPVEAATPRGSRITLTRVGHDLDAWWSAEFANRGLDYRRPRLVFQEGALTSRCNGEAYFAAYCPLGESLHIDPIVVAERTSFYGPALPTLILAHEWTHHVVTLLALSRDPLPTLPRILGDRTAEELLADCLAGAFMGEHWRRADADEDAFAGMMQFLMDNGGELHGPGEQRVEAFARGIDDGVDGCGLFDGAGATSRRGATQ
jgi:predicted metalloprotease